MFSYHYTHKITHSNGKNIFFACSIYFYQKNIIIQR